MPTVQEILKQTGLSDEQITALDTKAVQAFTSVLSTAEQERQRAEVERRANAQFYAESIAPALDSWATEKANYDAQLGYYKSQIESARASGLEFAPPPGQQRDNQGRYVAGAPGGTPGSPTFTIQDVRDGLGSTLGTLTDIQWKYQTLYGKPMPISPTELVRQAEAQRLDPATYAARTYQFAEKEAEQQRKTQEEHDAKIRADAEAARDRHWAEKMGSNPDVRIAQSSRYADVQRAVKAGERPDPLMLNEQQRKQATRQAIRTEVIENESNSAA